MRLVGVEVLPVEISVSDFPYRHFELLGLSIYLCYNAVIVSKEAVMMKKKSILAIGLTAALLFGLTGEAEAFGWGDIAGKAADKAIGSVLGSSAKKKTGETVPAKERETEEKRTRSGKVWCETDRKSGWHESHCLCRHARSMAAG